MTIREKAFQQSRATAVLSLLLGLIMIASMLDDTLTSVDSVAGDPFSATVVNLGLYRDARRLGPDRHAEETWFRARTGPFTMKDLTRPKQRFQTCLGQ